MKMLHHHPFFLLWYILNAKIPETNNNYDQYSYSGNLGGYRSEK